MRSRLCAVVSVTLESAICCCVCRTGFQQRLRELGPHSGPRGGRTSSGADGTTSPGWTARRRRRRRKSSSATETCSSATQGTVSRRTTTTPNRNLLFARVGGLLHRGSYNTFAKFIFSIFFVGDVHQVETSLDQMDHYYLCGFRESFLYIVRKVTTISGFGLDQ